MSHGHFNAVSLCIYLYFYQPQATKGATEQRKDFQCVLFLSLSRGENNKNVHECFRNKDAPATTPPLHPHPQSVSEPERMSGHKQRLYKKRKKRKLGREGITLPGFTHS